MLWDLVSRRPFLTGFPIHLDIELTSRCNLRCEMCFQRHMEEKREDMPAETFKRIVDEGVEEGLCSMKLQSRGESMIHHDILDLLAYTKKRGVLDVHITTNGLLLNDNKIKGLVENGLDLFILSYDKEHAKASVMILDEYTKFLQDVIRKIDKERKRCESRLKIRIQTCVKDYTQENIELLEKENKKIFPEAGTVLINPIYISYEDDPHLLNLEDYDFFPCSYLWQRLTVYADGSVTTCSRDYNCKYNRIGNIETNSIRELWHSPRMRGLRKLHLQRRRQDIHICAVCENYLINRKTGRPGAGCTGVVYEMGIKQEL